MDERFDIWDEDTQYDIEDIEIDRNAIRRKRTKKLILLLIASIIFFFVVVFSEEFLCRIGEGFYVAMIVFALCISTIMALLNFLFMDDSKRNSLVAFVHQWVEFISK